MDPQVTRSVSNPQFEDLSALLQRARTLSTLFSGVLDRPAALMCQDRVWTGPMTADVFASDLDGRRSELPGRFEDFIAAVQERRSRVSETIETPVWEL